MCVFERLFSSQLNNNKKKHSYVDNLTGQLLILKLAKMFFDFLFQLFQQQQQHHHHQQQQVTHMRTLTQITK